MINRHGVKAARMVDRLIQEARFQVESFTVQHAELAREAYARYGKGQQTAALNYGDCFSYALAKRRVCRYCSRDGIFQKPTSSQQK